MVERAEILIVDDDPDLLETYTMVLSNEYAVETAKDGAEAIKKSLERHFDVALIDLVLPDMSGIQLLKKLKSGTPKLRKIVITGHATIDNAIGALNLGADAFLIKPITPEALLKIICDQLVGQQREIRLIQQKVDEYANAKSYEERGNLFADVFNNVDFGVEVWAQKEINSEDFRLVFSNPAAERHTGISQKEKIGKRVDEVYSMLPIQNIPKLLIGVMDSKKNKKVPIYCILRDSQERNLFMGIVPLKGRFIAIILEDLNRSTLSQK
jgi:DNA-binding response OmpR family regulator